MSSINSYVEGRLTGPLARLLSTCQGIARRVCFWTAIVCPFLWVSLLFEGVVTASEHLTLAALVGINLLALLGGHSYRPDWDRRSPDQDGRPPDRDSREA